MKDKKKIWIAVRMAIVMLIILFVITTAIIGFKLMFRKYYRRPVPISPFMSYGQGFDENGNIITYVPVSDGKCKVILP